MSNTLRFSLLALLIALSSGSAAFAQEGRGIAAVLMVEDRGKAVTEQLGLAVFEPFLHHGPYAEVRTLVGPKDANARLAAVIRELAGRHAAIDVFCAVHTTDRDPEAWTRLIPAAARKLRLVYSTACYGNEHERQAWERVGAQTVVTHMGTNNPLISLPFFLSQWIQGAPVGDTVAAGYRETSLVTRFGLSLPGGEDLFGYGAVDEDPEYLHGSRPVISGDPSLRISTRMRNYTPRCPDALRYRRSQGSSLGLALRAGSGRFKIRGGDVTAMLESAGVPTESALPGVDPSLLKSGWIDDGRFKVRLARRVYVPLDDGFKLRFNERVDVRAGVLNPERRELRLKLDGVWVQRGLLRFKVSNLALLPAKEGDGYRVRAGVGLWGFIPLSKSIAIGGRRPEPIPSEGPIVLRDLEENRRSVEDRRALGMAASLVRTTR